MSPSQIIVLATPVFFLLIARNAKPTPSPSSAMPHHSENSSPALFGGATPR